MIQLNNQDMIDVSFRDRDTAMRTIMRLQNERNELIAVLNEILDNDGSRRFYNAGRIYDARAKAEELLK